MVAVVGVVVMMVVAVAVLLLRRCTYRLHSTVPPPQYHMFNGTAAVPYAILDGSREGEIRVHTKTYNKKNPQKNRKKRKKARNSASLQQLHILL